MGKKNLFTEEFIDKLKNNWILLTSLSYICLTIFGMIISYLRYIIYGVSIFELVDIDEFLIIGVRHLPFFILAAVSYSIYLWWMHLLIKLITKIISLFRSEKINYTFRRFKKYFIWGLVFYLVFLCFFNIYIFESLVESKYRLVEIYYSNTDSENGNKFHLLGITKKYLLLISFDREVVMIPKSKVTKLQFVESYEKGFIYILYKRIGELLFSVFIV